MQRNRLRSAQAFTLIELLTAISIAVVLMTLTLGVQRYASDKASRTKAEVEIRAMIAACENYKTDQAVYPRTQNSDALSSTSPDPSTYAPASQGLYKDLSGDADLNGKSDLSEGKADPAPVYLEFKTSQLGGLSSGGAVTYIRDPWDRDGTPQPYGYSTRRALLPDDTTAGYNSTFDIWSVTKQIPNKASNPKAWITNW